MKELIRRLRWLYNRQRNELELGEEMRHHRSLMDQPSRFGNPTLLREDSRAMWTFRFWEQFLQDLRYGVRAMAANRLFTLMAVLSLALGIGANTAIYSFMEAVLMRNLPVSRPEELVILNWSARDRTPVVHGVNGSMYRDDQRGRVSPNFPYPGYERLRDDRALPATVFAFAPRFDFSVVAQGQAEVLRGMYASGGYYRGLGVTPFAGRLLSDEDDRPGAPPVVVISHSWWQTRYAGADPLGSRIVINNIPFTVIGISAPGFFGVSTSHEADITVALQTMPRFAPNPEKEARRRFLDRNFYWVEMMARLPKGTDRTRAEQGFGAAFRSYVLDSATSEKERNGKLPQLWLQDGAGGFDALRRQYSKPLFVLMTMVGLILAIACANIANLLLSRATARRREMAVRMSLGAARARVIRQLLTESVLLSLSGGVLGLIVATGGIKGILWLIADPTNEFSLHASLNWPVLAFTLAITIATGILFGLAPALRATRGEIIPALKESRSSAPVARTRRFGLRFGLGHVLVVMQVAISLVLVVAAGLFVRTLAGLNAIETGFNSENILTFTVDAGQSGYSKPALANFYAGLAERFRTMPGVRNVGISDYALASFHWNDAAVAIPGVPTPTENKPTTALMRVNESFLATMQIPILLGRALEQRDMASPRVVVVSELFAKKYFPNANPIGKRIGLDSAEPADIEIVGVAKTTKYNHVSEEETPPLAYVPYTKDMADLHAAMFEVRAAGSPLALVPIIRRIVHDANNSVPVARIATQAAIIDGTISQQRTFANLCTGFAVLALVIACVGLYGTMSYAVARRTNEIGIRMALGARRPAVIRMVLRQVFGLAAVGLGIGLWIARQSGHFIESFLYGVKATDISVMASASAVLIVCTIAAGFGPAWRASRIDPMEALRHE